MTTSAFDIYPILMPAVFGLPLALALGLSIRSWQPGIVRLVPWSTVPALAALAWVKPDEMVSISWLLLDVHLALDPTGRIFLLFTSVLWLLAGIYAQSYLAADTARVKFFFFFMLSMSGNFGLIISQDVVSFYVFFALMSFASYGLVVHNGDAEALRAGQVYMVLVVIGEVALFAAFVWQTWSVDSLLLKDFSNVRPNSIALALILIGFGIKAGALPVHVWLPLAHPAAPTPASAVLSGTMIKAGLLGWLRFLPIGQIALPQWGTFCIVAGLLAAFYAVAVGLTQRNPKTVLAYSSISQMGLMTVGVGLAVGWPQTVPTVLPAIGIYAIHHAFAKGALFMGVGVVGAVAGHRPAYRIALGGLILASLALAGAPFTSGAVAKIALKLPLKDFQDSWVYALESVVAPGCPRHNTSHGPLSFCDDPALGCPRQAAVWHVAVVGLHDSADSCCGLVIAGGPESRLQVSSTAFTVAGAMAGCSGHTDCRQRMAEGRPEKMASGAVHTAGGSFICFQRRVSPIASFCFGAIETITAIHVCCVEKSSDTTTRTAGDAYASALA